MREEHNKLKKELYKEEIGLKEKPDDLIIQVKRRKSTNNDVKTRWGIIDLGFSTYTYSDDVPDLEGINPVETDLMGRDRKSTRLNSSHVAISYAVFCLKKKNRL